MDKFICEEVISGVQCKEEYYYRCVNCDKNLCGEHRDDHEDHMGHEIEAYSQQNAENKK